MKKSISRMLAVAMAAVLTLSACSGGGGTTPSPSASTEPSASAPASTTPEQSTTPTESAPAETPVVSTGEPIKDLVYPKLATRELQTFNILHSQSATDFENLTNLVDGLLEADVYGALVPAIAETWGTEDGGITWTFNIRDGVKWVDMNGTEKADCTAWDFATGLEFVLNYHKNESYNTSMPIEMIIGAGEYYEYTKALSEDEGMALTAGEGSKFLETVGVEIPNDLTIIFKCITEKPYFDTVATYSCIYPLSQAMVDELGGAAKVKDMNNQNMWYNGCYTMTSYIHGNEKIFTKNPLYWDTACDRFDTVTIKMVESNDIAFQLYQAGDVDHVPLTESVISTISGNPNHEFYDNLVPDVFSKYSYQCHFNFNKHNSDGTVDTNWNTAIANEAFRLAWYYGLDITEYYKRNNPLTPMVCENNFYTMKGLVYNSDGTDYVDLVREELGLPELNGETMVRLDKDKAAAYKAQAMEELAALGVTFPVGCDYYISGSNQTALDTANVLKQMFTDHFGDDFIVLNIKTYVSSARQEVYQPKLQSITINGWGADYGDPQNYLIQEVYGNDNAYYSTDYSNINDLEENEATKALIDAYKEFTDLVYAADAITTDMDARYAAYAKAEAYMLEHAFVVPWYYASGWSLSKVDRTSRINAMFGAVNDKMKNWRTNANGYTNEESNALEAAKAANK